MPSLRVLLCSDIHFTKRKNTHASAFLRDLDDGPLEHTCVVVPGDLVQSGSQSDYDQAEAFLGQIRKKGVPLVLTPGNHDFGGFSHESKVGLTRVSESARKRFRSLWRAHTKQACCVADDDMNAVYQVGDHVFVSLRSVHRGRLWGKSQRISSDQLDWARKTLRRNRLRGRPLHLVTHRGVWDDRKTASRAHRPMYRRRRLEHQLLEREGFQTIIHGHDHRFAWTPRRRLPKRGTAIDHLAVPSLSGHRKGKHGWARWTPGVGAEWVPMASSRD